MSSESVNTKHVSVPMPVPRDPTCYRATTHFSQRLRERFPNRDWDDLIKQTISSGELRGASKKSGSDVEGVHQSFGFTFEGVELIVGIRLKAFRENGEKHVATTIYETDGERE